MDCFAAIQYLFIKNKREDMFGNSLEERALIREIYYCYLVRKKKAITVFFKFP
jgi:hypothetical protein